MTKLDLSAMPRTSTRPRPFRLLTGVLSGWMLFQTFTAASENVALTEVPDYTWHAGCFGTAAGNLAGYWDRHGFPDLYTGPTGNGVAPLNSSGPNDGIRSMWASRAGFDGRPNTAMGHIDDYWSFYTTQERSSYESTAPDPYIAAGRTEHPPDCLSDFMGASQNKWKNLNGECDGNIDGYAVTYWDRQGHKRINFVPPPEEGQPIRDVPSGLRAWTQSRGYDCQVMSQLTDFNTAIPAGNGFTFANLKAEIDAGYPVILFLQRFEEPSRFLPGMPRANPNVHGMLAYGYFINESGQAFARYKTSWGGSGEHRVHAWNASDWEAQLPLRGVITYRPFPKIRSVTRQGNNLTFQWDGPSSTLTNYVTRASKQLHRYVIERSPSLSSDRFEPVMAPTTDRSATIENCCESTAFFRLRLLGPE